MIRVHAGGKWQGLEDIIRGRQEAPNETQDARAFHLIRQWMNGTSEFTFQTSGSTGIPNQITFNRDQLVASARISERALGLKSGYTSLICLDVGFIAGAMMIVRSLVSGMNMVIRPASANPFHGLDNQIDFAAVVPLQLTTILTDSPAMLAHLKTVIIGGAPLPEKVFHLIQGRSTNYYATYGMTETLTHVALQKLNEPGRQDAFHLLSGFTATCDERGCLALEATHLGPHPIATNDIVEMLSETTFRMVGRIDEVINSGGIKVHPQKVEASIQPVMNELIPNTRFFISGMPDERLGERIVLVLEGPFRGIENEMKVMKGLSIGLSSYEIPKEIRYSSQFIQTSTQKIDRKATLKSLQKK